MHFQLLLQDYTYVGSVVSTNLYSATSSLSLSLLLLSPIRGRVKASTTIQSLLLYELDEEVLRREPCGRVEPFTYPTHTAQKKGENIDGELVTMYKLMNRTDFAEPKAALSMLRATNSSTSMLKKQLQKAALSMLRCSVSIMLCSKQYLIQSFYKGFN